MSSPSTATKEKIAKRRSLTGASINMWPFAAIMLVILVRFDGTFISHSAPEKCTNRFADGCFRRSATESEKRKCDHRVSFQGWFCFLSQSEGSCPRRATIHPRCSERGSGAKGLSVG